MTDEEWKVFRADYLSRYNTYLSDAHRPLYDAPSKPRDGPGGARAEEATETPPSAPEARGEARGAKEVMSSSPYLDFDITQFIKGDK